VTGWEIHVDETIPAAATEQLSGVLEEMRSTLTNSSLRHRNEDPCKPFQESPLIAHQVPVAMARLGIEVALSAC
jgi:hypothetical protein